MAYHLCDLWQIFFSIYGYFITDDTFFSQKYLFINVLYESKAKNFKILLFASVENTDRYMFLWHKALLIVLLMPQQHYE